MKSVFNIVAVGLAKQEVETLEQILSIVDKQEQYQYQLVDKENSDQAQFAIVNADQAETVKNWRVWNARTKPLFSIYAYCNNAPRGAKASIKKPFTPSSVLKGLEQAVYLNFNVSADLAEDDLLTRSDRASLSVFNELSQSGNKTALIVEDGSSILKSIHAQLGTLGIKTESVNSGELALKAIDDKKFDIVFIDSALPGMGGYEVCKNIRHSFRHNDMAICMLTEKSKVFQVVRAKLAGSDRCVSKPIIAEELSNSVAELLRIDFNRSLKIA